MKEQEKYIVVVEFSDGSRKEFIVTGEENVGKGLSCNGGRIVAYRHLTKKYCD
jgi:hypothetical protein